MAEIEQSFSLAQATRRTMQKAQKRKILKKNQRDENTKNGTQATWAEPASGSQPQPSTYLQPALLPLRISFFRAPLRPCGWRVKADSWPPQLDRRRRHLPLLLRVFRVAAGTAPVTFAHSRLNGNDFDGSLALLLPASLGHFWDIVVARH